MWTSENVKTSLVDVFGLTMTPTTWMLNSKCLKETTKELRPVQNLTLEEADFKRFIGLRSQLVKTVENFGREQTLSQC